MTLSVRENAAARRCERFRRGPLLSRRREVAAVDRELESLAVKTPSREAVVSALSGGNQQKVVLARALLSRAGDAGRRRADPGRRRRRAGRDLPDPARGVRRRRPGGRGVVGRQGARGPVRPRHRDVARARSSRPSTGDDITEERLINAAVRATGTPGRAGGHRDGSRGSTRSGASSGRLRAGGRPRARHVRARRLRPEPELPLPVRLQHHLGDDLVRRARLHRPRSDGRAPDRRHRPVGRSAVRLPRGRRLASSSTTASPAS